MSWAGSMVRCARVLVRERCSCRSRVRAWAQSSHSARWRSTRLGLLPVQLSKDIRGQKPFYLSVPSFHRAILFSVRFHRAFPMFCAFKYINRFMTKILRFNSPGSVRGGDIPFFQLPFEPFASPASTGSPPRIRCHPSHRLSRHSSYRGYIS